MAAPRWIPTAFGTVLMGVLATAATAQSPDGAPDLPDLAPPGAQPVLYEIAHAPSVDRLRSTLETLVGFGTRHTLSDTVSDTRGVGAARRWVHAEFERISEACGGCLEVSYIGSMVEGDRLPEPTRVENVVAVQRGTSDPNRYILVSGHLDSRVSDGMDAESRAPGANDDGSGVAAVIEAARVLSQYEFGASIIYVAVTGEEQGLYGSRHLAQVAVERGWNVEAMITNDVVGNIHGQNGVVNNTVVRVFSEGTRADETERMARIRRYTGGEVDSPSRNLARYMNHIADEYMPNFEVMMIYRLDRFGRGGDHRPFNAAGFAAVRVTETNENYTQQHQDVRVENGIQYGDLLEFVDFPYLAKVTGLNTATLAALAWAPQPPTGVGIDGAVDPSTTLQWEPLNSGQNPDLAGYKIYWRLTTAPVWTSSVFVGGVTEFTLENVVIDNYFFGVASVSERGFESPVVFPGPVGAFEPAERTQTATRQ